jgi:hypothetical protein
LEWRGGLEGFQVTIHPRGYMGAVYSARDVWAVHTMLTVQCRESEPTKSRFGYHTHRRLHSVHCTCEVNGKINFNDIYLISLKIMSELSVDYEQLRQMVMDMRSQIGGTRASPICSYGPGNNQPPPSPPPTQPFF